MNSPTIHLPLRRRGSTIQPISQNEIHPFVAKHRRQVVVQCLQIAHIQIELQRIVGLEIRFLGIQR